LFADLIFLAVFSDSTFSWFARVGNADFTLAACVV